MQDIPVFTADILQDIQRLPQQAYDFLDRQAQLHPELSYVVLVVIFLAFIAAFYLLYRTIPGVKYEIQLWLYKIFESGHRQYVLRVLRDENVPVEVMLVQKGSVQQLATGLIYGTKGNSVLIKLTSNLGVNKEIKNTYLYCYYKPILHFTIRTNSFRTYAMSFEQDRYGNDILTVKLPVKMEVQERRRHKRKRIRTQRTIMARVWLREPDAIANGKFRFAQPSFQVNVERGLGNRAQERFFDVSPHGARFGVQRALLKDELLPDSSVCVEVRPFIKSSRKFFSFYFAGRIRHLNQARSGLIIVGVEFLQIAVKSSGPGASIDWKDIERSHVTKHFTKAIVQL